jgi:hypothetical protein
VTTTRAGRCRISVETAGFHLRVADDRETCRNTAVEDR